MKEITWSKSPILHKMNKGTKKNKETTRNTGLKGEKGLMQVMAPNRIKVIKSKRIEETKSR